MTKSNFLLINRKPQVLEEVIPGEKGLIFLGKDRRILDYGVLVMDCAQPDIPGGPAGRLRH